MKNWNTCTADKVRILTKHFTPGRAGERIRYIVIHHNGGTLTTDGCYDVWQTRPASAHYQVEKGGRVGQLVWDKDTAWHAADALANRRSIGIEHANESSSVSKISEATLDNGAHLVAALCHLYGLGRPEWKVNVYPHNQFTSTDCPGHLDGDQREAYMRRAQAYYDAPAVGAMSATRTFAPKPVSFAATMRGITGADRGKATGNLGILQDVLIAKRFLSPGARTGVWDAATGSAYDAFLRAKGFSRGAEGRPLWAGWSVLMREGGWSPVL